MGWISKAYSDVYSTALMQDGYWAAPSKEVMVPVMEKPSIFRRLFGRG